MVLNFTGTAEVERSSGKFVSREEIAEKIAEAIAQAGPGLNGLGADGDSHYELQSIEVSVS